MNAEAKPCVDRWALKEMAFTVEGAARDADRKLESVFRPIHSGDVDELELADFHNAWASIRDLQSQLEVLAHMAGYSRLELGAAFDDVTPEEREAFEARCER